LDGIVPLRELELRSNTVREAKPPREEVIVPVIPVLERLIVCNKGIIELIELESTG